MAFTIEKFNSCQEQQGSLRELVGLPMDPTIRCLPFRGLGQALIDLLYGLKFFWPTKKNLLITPWGSPQLMPAVQGFVKEGQTLIKRTTGTVFPELPKDLLGAVLVRDHCFTGEIVTTDEELQFCNENKIPHIEIQYAWAWSGRVLKPLPFGAQIRVLDAQKAIVVLGSRFRFMSHSTQLMDWSDLCWKEEAEQCKQFALEDLNWLSQIEEKIQNRQPDLKWIEMKNKLRDRLVLYTKGVHGVYFLEQLLDKNDKALISPGFEHRYETTNLTRWEGTPTWDWWGEKRLTDEEQRSLVVLSLQWMKSHHIDFEVLNEKYLNCLKECRT